MTAFATSIIITINSSNTATTTVTIANNISNIYNSKVPTTNAVTINKSGDMFLRGCIGIEIKH
jgi:hypothetical protein